MTEIDLNEVIKEASELTDKFASILDGENPVAVCYAVQFLELMIKKHHREEWDFAMVITKNRIESLDKT